MSVLCLLLQPISLYVLQYPGGMKTQWITCICNVLRVIANVMLLNMVGSITLILIVFTQTTAALKVKLKIMGALRPKIK